MKIQRHIFRAIVCVILTLPLSCSHAIDEVGSDEDFSSLDPTFSFIPFSSTNNALTENVIKSCPLPGGEKEAVTRTTSITAQGVLKQHISRFKSSDIRSYCGTYMTTDENDQPIKVSGRIIVPTNKKVSRVMVVSHFTIGTNAEAPSQTLPIESIFASQGIAVVIPDYIGFGVTVDRLHPYLCDDLTAKNVADMYFAALPFLEFIGCKPQYDDIFLFGYSQGGAATISVQDYFRYNYPLNIIRLTMAGAGPYDIATTYDILIEREEFDFPAAIPMIIQGLDVGEKLELDYAQFYTPEICEHVNGWINSKQYNVGQLNELIGSKRVRSILTAEALDKTNPMTLRLYNAMLHNSLHDYIPESPTYLFHSMEDNVVPFENSANLRDRLNQNGGANVTYNFGNYGTHSVAFVRFIMSCLNMLEDAGDI